MTQTCITLLLDRSGSMRSILNDTIGGYNTYKDALRTANGVFSLVTFDDQSIDKIHTHISTADIPDLTPQIFVPRGGTPLIDATMKTIKAVERSVAAQPDTKVVIAILTDGEENQSTEFTWNQLQAEISAKTELGWQFVFLGAGIDAYQQASRMGIGADQTMSYDAADRATTLRAWEASAVNTVAYASGAAETMSFSASDKAAAGDKFVPQTKAVAPALKPMPPIGQTARASIRPRLEDFDF